MLRGQSQPHDITPEDIARGVVLALTFRDAESEVAKGAALVGEPKIDHGLGLDSSNQDALVYTLNGQFTEKTTISYHAIFSPDFASDDGLEHVVFSSTPTLHYQLRKHTSDQLQFRMGNAAIVNVVHATFGPLWRINKPNVVSFWGTSGDSNVAFNRTQIVTTDVTAWSPTVITELIIGMRALATGHLGGRVGLIKFQDTLTTLQEHLDLCAGVGI